jgi:flagellar hook assembly protein FlgD
MTLRQHPVRTLKFDAGVSVEWDGKDDSGQVVPAGLYLYLLKVDGAARRGSVVVLK